MYNAPKKSNTTIRAKREQRIVRVLIAIAPTMYWETLELALLRYRPHLEVKITDPDALDREVVGFEPHVVVCHKVTPTVGESVPSWVEVPYHDSSEVTIHVQGRGESRVENISVGDLFAVVDQTEELLSDSRHPGA